MKAVNKIFSVFIYIKRCFRHFGIVLLLVCLPLAAFVFRGFTEKHTGAAVGLCGGEKRLMQNLTQREGYIHFIEYDDSEKMKNDVETQKLECGFVFPDEEGKLTEIKTLCGVGYTSVLADVTQEAVFSELLKIYGRNISFEFTKKNDIGLDEEKFNNTYDSYLGSIKTAVVFEETDIKTAHTAQDDRLLNCIAAIAVICSGLAGTSLFVRDRKKGIYYDVSGNIAAVLILFDISLIIAFAILGKNIDIIRLILLDIAVWGLCAVIGNFIHDERVPWMLMPICIGFAAVFDIFEVSALVPALKAVDLFLLSHYYVYSGTITLAAVAAVLAAVGAVLNNAVFFSFMNKRGK